MAGRYLTGDPSTPLRSGRDDEVTEQVESRRNFALLAWSLEPGGGGGRKRERRHALAYDRYGVKARHLRSLVAGKWTVDRELARGITAIDAEHLAGNEAGAV